MEILLELTNGCDISQLDYFVYAVKLQKNKCNSTIREQEKADTSIQFTMSSGATISYMPVKYSI